MPTSIKDEYLDAVVQWLEDNEGEVEPAFWELGFIPSDEAASQSVRRVAQAIHERSACDSETAALTLLHLIRSRLSDIRINYMWPEVARILSSDEYKPTGAKCGNFFRDVLGKYAGDSIPNVHNRYVAYCLDQTAVGPDRTRVVLEFFEFLLRQIIDIDRERPAGIEVSDICDKFISHAEDKDNVEVYRIQLERNGQTIVNLIRELRSGDVFHEIGFWDWESLRQWWKEHSGEDLNRLTPETRDALQSVIARVEDSLTYQTLKAFVRKHKGKVAIQFPDQETRAVELMGTSPLGPIRVRLGSVERDLQLRDSFGLTGRLIAAKPSDCWHDHKSRAVFGWRQDPFEVNRDGNMVPAKPFYVGSTVDTAHLKGYYFATECDDGSVPRVSDARFKHNLRPRFSLSYEWRIEEGGFCLRLDGIYAKFLTDEIPATLVLGNEVIWQGTIKGKFTKLGKEYSFTSGDPLNCELLDYDQEPLKVFSINPPTGAFVAVDGIVQKHESLSLPKALNGDQFPSGIILGIESKEEPKGLDCSIKKIRPLLPYSRWSFYRVRPEDGSAFFQISIPPFRWEFESGSPVALVEPQEQFELPDGITVSKSRDTVPFSFDDPIRLRLVRFANRQTPAKGFRLLLSTSAGQKFRWNIGQLAALVDEDGETSLRQLFEGSGYEVPVGHLRIYSQKSGIGFSESIRVFRTPEHVRRLECRIGQHPKLRLVTEHQDTEIVSPDIANRELANDVRKVEGWLADDHGGIVRFEWPINVVDMILLNCGEPSSAASIDLSNLDQFSFLNVSGDRQLSLQCLDRAVELEPGNQIALTELLRDVFETSTVSANDAEVKAVADEPLGSWIIDLTPRSFTFDGEWNNDDPSILDVSGSFVGNPNGLSIQVVGPHNLGITSASVDNISLVDSQSLRARFAESVAVPAGVQSLLDDDDPGSILLKVRDTIVARNAIPPLVSTKQLDIKREISDLVRSLGTPFDLDDLRLFRIVALIEQFLRHNGGLPFQNMDALSAKLVGHGSDECREHAFACVRLLKALATDTQDQMFDVPWQSDSPLRLMMVSLAVIYQKRLHNHGLADPRMTASLEDALEFLVTGSLLEKEKRWARTMLEFMMSDSVHALPHEASDNVDVNRLVGFDDALNGFVEKIGELNGDG